MATTDEMVDGGNEHKGLARALRRRSRVAWPGSGPADGPGPNSGPSPDPGDDGFHIYVYEREF